MFGSRFLRVMLVVDILLAVMSVVWGGYALMQGDWKTFAGETIHLLVITVTFFQLRVLLKKSSKKS